MNKRQQLKEIAWDAQKAIMIPCQKCGKRILADRFSTHLDSCFEPKIKPATAQVDLNRPSPSKGTICYVCGRKYGNSSIGAHEIKCLGNFSLSRNIKDELILLNKLF